MHEPVICSLEPHLDRVPIEAKRPESRRREQPTRLGVPARRRRRRLEFHERVIAGAIQQDPRHGVRASGLDAIVRDQLRRVPHGGTPGAVTFF